MKTEHHHETKQEKMMLSDAEAGDKFKVTSIEAGQALKNRLASLGIFPGTILEVVTGSRGPFIVKMNQGRLMLGRGITHKIRVQKS